MPVEDTANQFHETSSSQLHVHDAAKRDPSIPVSATQKEEQVGH